MWIEENARELISRIATIPLWRDTYPDAEYDRAIGRPIEAVFSPEDVRLARALLETK